MVQQLLHGTLYVTIYEIDRLQNGCGFGSFPQCGKKFLSQVKEMLCPPEVGGSQIYATVDLDRARMARTRTLRNQSSKPRWNQFFHIYCAHSISYIIFTVKDDNPIGATLIGRAYVHVEDVIRGYIVDKWVPILDPEGNPIPKGSKIHVRLEYVDVANDNNWSQGIRSPNYAGVPYSFFNQRQGCKVTLYQDAHVQDDFKPQIPLLGGNYYESHRCWEDIFDAIMEAKHFIYVTGWSVYTEITLIRDPMRPKPGGNITLGELLKKRADEGVLVLMLVWDDRTSVDVLKQDGLMSTHDEETANYFQNTKVNCVLCPRISEDNSVIQGFRIATMFTHHQKTVVVDSEILGEASQKRRIVSFVGGIDLCDGRYDIQDHPLFKSLETVHRDDFHQPNFRGSSIKKGGPREPWHDIHCRLEGPVAWDVLYNFEQRWKRQVPEKLKGFLISQKKLGEILIHPFTSASSDTESWNVQIFRSIDGGAADFPTSYDQVNKLRLVLEKDNVIDKSIEYAYITAIRRAKKFIYIENQYFLGSSYGWSKEKDGIIIEDINALHIIPKELSLKIVSKIEAGERFTVYIVIPMWPEGIPESGSVQAILDWQRRTMEMMYADVAQAIQRKGLDAHPREYLTFFCLGNREKKRPTEYEPEETPEPNSDYYKAQQARRFMIYVHSKMMIVDDEYIIIGSANINQRSMDGARDTEIAMGAFEPQHLATNQPARGQIYGFRMALWFEHLGVLVKAFQDPETEECVRLVNQIADEDWRLYTDKNSDEDLAGHLLPYPVEVTHDGVVKPLTGTEFFPDTEAPVLGKKSDYLPPILTT